MAMSSITVKGIVPSLLILGGFQDFIYDQPTSIFRTTNNFIPTISIPSITNWELRNNNLSGFRWVHNTDFGDTTGELNLQSFVNNLSIGNNIVLIDQDLNFQIVSRLVIPFGDNNRPLTPKVGTLRVNTVSNNLEFYTDQWRNAGGGTGGTGTVTSITAGTGLTGGTITDSGTIALANTAVTAGTYNYATVTVDAQGRLTNVVENEIGTGTVTSITAGTGLTGGTITNTGTIALTNSSVVVGTYNYATLTVDAQGRLTAASSGTSPITSISGTTNQILVIGTTTPTISLTNNPVIPGNASLTLPVGTVLQRPGTPILGMIRGNSDDAVIEGYNGTSWLTFNTSNATVSSITAGTGLIGGTITNSGTIALNDTTVIAGTYNYATVTIDAQGRITNAIENEIEAGTVTSITTGTGLTGGIITDSGTISIANTTVTAGSYNYATLTVNAQGQLISASSGSPVTSITAGTGLSGGTITDSGTIALANTAVAAGSYDYANITVDAQGRLTSAATNTTPVGSVTGTVNQIAISGTVTAPVVGFVNNPTVPGTSHISIPTGTTAQRPTTPSLGMIRINTSL